MADFGIRFFFCNIIICIIIGFLLIAKRILKNHLTGRLQFHVWFLLLGILAVPFIPVRPVSFLRALTWLDTWKKVFLAGGNAAEDVLYHNISGTANQINDFALSVTRKTPPMIGLILCGIWLVGVIAMAIFVIRSRSRLNSIKKSALPLQNKVIHTLYHSCLTEMNIKKYIPIYSTAFLKSPVIVGLFKPCIYLPIHLISDFDAGDMRYMLLHELQHYRHKDALAGFFMNLFSILYWCNPFVWYAWKEMRIERELACDASVLKLLKESEYEEYGNTLINFAAKVSHTSLPFAFAFENHAVGISGSMKQMRRRILNISSYKKPSFSQKIKGMIAFAIIGVILLGFAPMLSTYAADQSRYSWDIPSGRISTLDLSAHFRGYEGCFVLYDQKGDTWNIYDMEQAALRTSPNSTYKIYDALFGLEEGVITPADSFLAWDGADYPFEAWNKDQDLFSAMQSSVNWYFTKIDEQLGSSAIQNYIRKIGYGNENIRSSLSSYWLEGTLKISPVEQIELLTDLNNNRFGFATENINAVKDSIRLFSSESRSFYGKTGTGRVDGQDVNGWFVGYVETADNTYFFAANIQAAENATGSKAAEITLAILSGMDIWMSLS